MNLVIETEDRRLSVSPNPIGRANWRPVGWHRLRGQYFFGEARRWEGWTVVWLNHHVTYRRAK